jgi:uncharacterized protein YndB with AHSA1/START domain
MGKEPVIIERTFNAPIAKVWKAITDRDEMEKWYFNLKEFKPEIGFKFQFEGGPPDKVYVHLCKVVDVIDGKKISYSWKFKGYDGISFVTFELFAEGNKTKVKLTHEGIETFPASNPGFAKHNFVEGWTSIIGTSLYEYLDKIA